MVPEGVANSDYPLVLEHFTAVVGVIVQRRAPSEVAPWLAGAQLVALEEKDGSIRTVAVGEFLRRLTAKVLCDTVQGEAGLLLWPLQIGVAQRGGCLGSLEAGSHTGGYSKHITQITDQWETRLQLIVPPPKALAIKTAKGMLEVFCNSSLSRRSFNHPRNSEVDPPVEVHPFQTARSTAPSSPTYRSSWSSVRGLVALGSSSGAGDRSRLWA